MTACEPLLKAPSAAVASPWWTIPEPAKVMEPGTPPPFQTSHSLPKLKAYRSCDTLLLSPLLTPAPFIYVN